VLISKCPSCFEPLHSPNRCDHRQRYLDVAAYVTSQGIRISNHDYEWWAWKAADSQKDGHDRYIRISSVAYEIYGWDVMTSILIHEFGHCALFNEGIGAGSSSEENLEIEKKANRRGAESVPAHLVPEDYQRHREFFLNSYLEEDWTEEKCRSAWQAFQQTLDSMSA
jgi:hypothetical protein